MSSLNSKIDRLFISLFISGILIFSNSASAWQIDFTRRQLEFNKVVDQERGPASLNPQPAPKSLLDKVLDVVEPTQDVVILNTENGFIPESVQLRQNGQYKIHVVNVNSKNKNISFILDAFSENHNTLFAQEKTFTVSPKAEGVFSFLCPETAATGKLVVVPSGDGRKPASN